MSSYNSSNSHSSGRQKGSYSTNYNNGSKYKFEDLNNVRILYFGASDKNNGNFDRHYTNPEQAFFNLQSDDAISLRTQIVEKVYIYSRDLDSYKTDLVRVVGNGVHIGQAFLSGCLIGMGPMGALLGGAGFIASMYQNKQINEIIDKEVQHKYIVLDTKQWWISLSFGRDNNYDDRGCVAIKISKNLNDVKDYANDKYESCQSNQEIPFEYFWNIAVKRFLWRDPNYDLKKNNCKDFVRHIQSYTKFYYTLKKYLQSRIVYFGTSDEPTKQWSEPEFVLFDQNSNDAQSIRGDRIEEIRIYSYLDNDKVKHKFIVLSTKCWWISLLFEKANKEDNEGCVSVKISKQFKDVKYNNEVSEQSYTYRRPREFKSLWNDDVCNFLRNNSYYFSIISNSDHFVDHIWTINNNY